MHERELRKQLIHLLQGRQAHMTFDEAVADFPMDLINVKPTNVEYSFWDLLEHIRRTQYDILDFICNPKYQEMEWPKDYWPEKGKQASEKDWHETINLFKKDMKELENIINDRKTDLYAKIPHGSGQNILREIMVVADHTSYHIGEFGILRQVMNAWPEK